MPVSVVALVPAAGHGERLGAAMPKALVPLAGRPLLCHALGALLGSDVVDTAVVAAPAAHLDDFRAAVAGFADRTCVVPGGWDRTRSVGLALAAAGPGAEVLLVHDAARCLVPVELIRLVVAAVRAGAGAVVPVLPVADTVKQIDDAGFATTTVDRSILRVVQTPQGFTAELLRRAYDGVTGSATDDAGLAERLGEPVQTVPGHPLAFKITTPFDLTVAEALLSPR